MELEPRHISKKTWDWMRKQPGFKVHETRNIAGVEINMVSSTTLPEWVAVPVYVMPDFADPANNKNHNETEKEKTMKDYDLLEKYQSHKIVKAAKIKGIEIHKDGSATIATDNEYVPVIKTKPEYKERFKGDENELGYYVRYKDGYESWSPTKAFEEGYSPVAEKSENQGPSKTRKLHFGEALECLKAGLKVSRTGWNGKGMYAVMMPGYPDGVPVNETTQRAHGVTDGTILKYRPYFQLLTAQGDVAMWSPSGSDILAEDWMVLN